MICPKCNATIADNTQFCTECGSPLSTKPTIKAVVDPIKKAMATPAPVSNDVVTSKPKIPHYVVVQVVLKEKLIGTGSGVSSLSNLQKVINDQAAKGYRLHTITTASANSTGWLGGDRIQATLVFEKL